MALWTEDDVWYLADLLARTEDVVDDPAAPIAQLLFTFDACTADSEDRKILKRFATKVESGEIHVGEPYPERP